jgi:hypothetical protein
MNFSFDDQKPISQYSFASPWVGSRIPASVKKVKLSVLWKYPTTNELVTLYYREGIIEQSPPSFNCSSAATFSTFSSDSTQVDVLIKNVFVNYEVPIDVDSLNRVIKATLADVKFDGVVLDSSKTQLGLAPINASTQATQKVSPSLMCRAEVLDTEYNPKTAEILVRVRIRKPQNKEAAALGFAHIQGFLTFQVSASIVNTKAGKSSNTPQSMQLLIKI